MLLNVALRVAPSIHRIPVMLSLAQRWLRWEQPGYIMQMSLPLIAIVLLPICHYMLGGSANLASHFFSAKTCEHHFVTVLHLCAKCGSFMLLPGSFGSVPVSVKWHRPSMAIEDHLISSFHARLCGFSVNFVVAHMVSENWWIAFECHQAISFKVQNHPLNQKIISPSLLHQLKLKKQSIESRHNPGMHLANDAVHHAHIPLGHAWPFH